MIIQLVHTSTWLSMVIKNIDNFNCFERFQLYVCEANNTCIEADNKQIWLLVRTLILYLNLSFITVYTYLSDDISVRKNATQESTAICLPPSVCETNNAVDRNINTCSKTTPIGQASTKSIWWYVDLGEILSVFDIRIQFKDYGPELGK